MRNVVAPPFALLLAATSCGGQAADKVRPPDFTAANALGAPLPVCTGEPKLAMPLVLDLDVDARIDLEAAMKKGLVVVAYDCNTLRVLNNCKANEDKYDYVQIDRREHVYHLKGADEVKANLPTSGARFGAEVKAGRSIDLGIVMIGRHNSHTEKVEREQLAGACEGATHFLQKATLGAFSVVTGSSGEASAVADVFGLASASGKSTSARQASIKDGSLDACRAVKGDSETPTEGCRSPISVELEPIKARGAKDPAPPAELANGAAAPPGKEAAPAKAVENPCRPGFLFTGGTCTKEPPADTGFVCERFNAQQCKEQCAKGNADSCYNYGLFGAKEDDDALAAFKQACEGQSGDGCYRWGRAVRPKYNEQGSEQQFRTAFDIFKRGCSMGSADACAEVAITLEEERTAFMRDLPASFAAWRRSCSLGSSTGCFWAANGYATGKGTPKSSQKSLDLFATACAGGNDKVCDDFASELMYGRFFPKDLPRALPIVKDLCENAEAHNRFPGIASDEGPRCEKAAKVLAELGQDAEAFEYASRACAKSESYCVTKAKLMIAGRGTKKDVAGGSAILKKYCANEMNRIAESVDQDNNACAKYGPPVKPKGGRKPKKK